MTRTDRVLASIDLPLVREISMVIPDLRYQQVRHRHPWHEIVLVMEGAYAVDVAGQHWSGGPGDLFSYPAGCGHRPNYDRDLSTRLFILAWEGGPKLEGPWQRRDSDGRVFGLLHWMRELVSSAEARPSDLLTVLATAVLLHLAEGVDPSDPAERAHDFLARNLDHPIDLPQVAGIVGLGPRRLNQIYRERYGCSPMRALARLRAQAAARLLRDDRQDLPTIAMRVGLGSASALSRLLKRELGRRPTELRSGGG